MVGGLKMYDLKKLKELDAGYIATLSNRVDKPWGTIFSNKEMEEYWFANHVNIDGKVENPSLIIDEVVSFYHDLKIVPRFYIYNLEKQANLLAALQQANFKMEEWDDITQVWNNHVGSTVLPESCKVEEVTISNYDEALMILCEPEELGGVEVREKAFAVEFQDPHFTYYLLRENGIAVSLASVYRVDKQAKLETVATLEKHRGKGLVGKLVRQIQKEMHLLDVENLWVYPSGEKVAKVYNKYGFETIVNKKMLNALLETET
jgi:ribosomal protein S18 acetylase RimI-like enzyme